MPPPADVEYELPLDPDPMDDLPSNPDEFSLVERSFSIVGNQPPTCAPLPILPDWADPSAAVAALPQADSGAFWVVVRAHGGDHEIWWEQGPYPAESWSNTEVELEPPAELAAPGDPQRPLLVMARVQWRGDDGSTEVRRILPRLVIIPGEDPVWAPELALEPTVDLALVGGDVSADIP